MKLSEDQPTKKSELGNKIKKSLSAYMQSNSDIFATKELRMIAHIKNNQSRNNVRELENIMSEEQEICNYEPNTISRKNVIVDFGGFISKMFRRYNRYEIESDNRFPIPVIKFQSNTYILFGNPFKEETTEGKVLQFKIPDREYNDYINTIKGVWLKWCA